MIVEIKFGEMLQILRRQIAPEAHEAEVDRLLAEPAKVLMQALLIVGADRTDSDRDAVAQVRIDAVVSRIDADVLIAS